MFAEDPLKPFFFTYPMASPRLPPTMPSEPGAFSTAVPTTCETPVV
jgi:hypothetical protein